MQDTFDIAVLPGDGIGVDVTREAIRVLDALAPSLDSVNFNFKEYAVGAGEFLRNGDPLPSEALDACGRADAVLLGAMGLPEVRWPDGKEMTPQIDLREKFQLYNGLRPICLYHKHDSPLKGYNVGEIDLVIVREKHGRLVLCTAIAKRYREGRSVRCHADYTRGERTGLPGGLRTGNEAPQEMYPGG